MSEDEQRILAGYSHEMLAAAVAELNASILAGRAGEWECDRFDVLHAEQQRREAAKIEPQRKAA